MRGPSVQAQQLIAEQERTPERIMHARGAGAHGNFRPYSSWLGQYTTAPHLTDPEHDTPVFTRFSTLAGARASSDTVRDARGFAVRFATGRGVHDLVGSTIPVFFLRDAARFPEFIRSLGPDPHTGIPHAGYAHDDFWRFVPANPEALHATLWLLSDRGLPRSYRTMPGYSVHSFHLIDEEGHKTHATFHWAPLLGEHALLEDEARRISALALDFHRLDLRYAIADGLYPQWELGVQLLTDIPDSQALDSTRLVPEEGAPVHPVGRMILDRNPDDFRVEIEQAAFRPDRVVPGVEWSAGPDPGSWTR